MSSWLQHDETRRGVKKLLCRYDPPQMVASVSKQGHPLIIPVSPVVLPDNWCSQFIDRETKETFDRIMQIDMEHPYDSDD